MSVVLITGAYGFVGANVSLHLAARGHHLWALDLRCSADASSCRGTYARDFTWEDFENIPWAEVDAVVHLAGKAHDTRKAIDPQSYFDINVGLTEKVIQSYAASAAMAQSKIRRFILFSSVKAVADRVEGVLTEEAVPNPQTPYGKSKLEAERTVLKFGSSGMVKAEIANQAKMVRESDFQTLELKNFRTYVLRPCMIHGPGNKGNLNLLYGMVRRGIPWPLGAFENRRSFASIGNVCAAVEGLLAGDAAAGVYQVADDEPLSTNEVVALMAESLGRGPRIWKTPAALVEGFAKLGDVARFPLNSERLKKLTESYVVSNDKLKDALGWERMPVAAREGMLATLKSFG